MNERYFIAPDARFYEERLENGLLVRVIPRPGFARKLAFMATNFGSADCRYEKDGKQVCVPDGIAHYLEHKMFDMPDGNAMEQFAQYAGSNNAFTNYFMTAYYVECTEQFAQNLQTLLDMVMTPYFTDESVEKERGIIEQEIRMYEDSAESAVFERLLALMYPKHPISAPIAGTVESIAEITAPLLHECYKQFYDPANFVLCVMGDVDAQEVIDLAKAHTPKSIGKIPACDYGGKEAKIAQAGRTKTRMEVSMPTFAAGFGCDEDGLCKDTVRRDIIGDLAAEMLAGESTALYQRLYDSNLIDAGFSIDFEHIRGVSLIEVAGDSEDPDAVLEAILQEAERIDREGLDDAQFERLRKSFLGHRMRDLDSFQGTCYRICAYVFEGAEYFDVMQALRSVTKQEVEDFLRRTIRRERMAVSIIEPKER